MRLPPISIAKLMAVVAVLAVNVAVARVLSADQELLAGVAPTGLALQIGLFLSIRSRDRLRMFWAGFVAFGLLAMMTFLWAAFFPRSTMSIVWTIYSEFATLLVKQLPWPRHTHGNAVIIETILAVSWSLPQLLFAMVGGWLTRCIGKRSERATPSERVLPTASQ